ncbi:hydroxymethylbilane synthase [Nocardia farcinica]|uniref:Porphobilinogen deaminase n=1 Tax=Nocardia farcinica TaxID=37329 RepID=A0A0H5P348_NOCFR|nr:MULTISPECIES: hydroxymethylbilane synthase [Nocardia]AXK87569.1 hydroxymethylbilane synthase [Nocardia farcinica]MBA4858851.1 hydroxymethylbilane synthase [Nocardia farcinica]MBC9816845.1 hydroxymethylbilane synthase [Nocardia farcinica]MBF6187002.1 hydroxymethylbilane synthase [Nocardia farcinica]MBF6232012.1 hydroxymethylbilane synthase [Nocardia farcinica]
MIVAQEQGNVGAAATGTPLRIGTRGSLLAMTQAGTVRDALIAAGRPAELVVVKTPGDMSSDPVQKIGVGVFTSALRDELAAGTIDLAVHSYKDLPTAPDPRFVIAAIPPREDPRDALVARDGLVLGELPAGAKVGTSAPRRVAQLRALGLGLDIVPLRGNLDSRLARVTDGELDAVVVARAGLSRIGRTAVITEALEPVQMLPAPAQGALAVECRSEDAALIEALAELDDAATRAAVVAERALLAELEAGCTAPVGALAEVVESLDDDGRIVEELSLRGCAAAVDGSEVLRASVVGDPERAAELGRALARELLELGARELLVEVAATEPGARSGTGAVRPPETDLSNPSPMENPQ